MDLEQSVLKQAGFSPAAFMELPINEASPIYGLTIGLSVIGFAFVLGFGAT